MEIARRRREETDAILNRYCYNDNYERKVTKPVGPKLRIDKNHDLEREQQETDRKYRDYNEDKDKIVLSEANY
eukprot:CAMPEP_0116891430 /NCGR_PEP_ID=MMETSP0467-20121206/1854_1 /TAXON_ID=283647 /ORGANISM="Mesodinium pulex, Strain SPMC105" /LENGTH=72 /DNA_ID=CAMNT_0004559953 /DNA_START=585 /DNA_END=803 /DNA_ORIENTATION=-